MFISFGLSISGVWTILSILFAISFLAILYCSLPFRIRPPSHKIATIRAMAWNLFIGYLVALFIGIVIQTMKMLLMSIVRPLLPQWPEGCLHRYIRRRIKIHSAYSIDWD